MESLIFQDDIQRPIDQESKIKNRLHRRAHSNIKNQVCLYCSNILIQEYSFLYFIFLKKGV